MSSTTENEDYPIIDGHFWVQTYDGKIIDPYFQKEYDFIKKFNDLTDEMVHLETHPTIQRRMISIFKKSKSQKYIINMNIIQPYQCFSNSMIEIKKSGGTLKFGSMGWHKKLGGVHYEFGGEKFSYIDYFVK